MKRGKRYLLSVLAIILWMGIPVAGRAAFVSSISTPTDVVVGGDWSNFMISWSIGDNSDGTWTYSYDFSFSDSQELSRPDISHWILEVSSGFNMEENFSWEGNSSLELGTFSPSDPGASNPGLPGDILGIKFDGGGSGPYIFISDKNPVPGDFYANGGSTSYAFNSAFDGSGSAVILRPDSLTNGNGNHKVPEPSTLLLLGSGLVGFGMWASKRHRT